MEVEGSKVVQLFSHKYGQFSPSNRLWNSSLYVFSIAFQYFLGKKMIYKINI